MSSTALLRRLAVASLWLTALALLAGGAAYHWRGQILDRLEGFAKARLLKAWVRRIEPRLPFRVEETRIEASWEDIKKGRIPRLAFTLRYEGWRARLSGPVRMTVDRSFHRSSIRYAPEATLEPVSDPKARTTPVRLVLWGNFTRKFEFRLKDLLKLREYDLKAEDIVSAVEGLGLEGRADHFGWPYQGTEAKKPSLKAGWSAGTVELSTDLESAEWHDPTRKTENAISIGKLSLRARTPFSLAPFALGPELSLTWTGTGSEALFGARYVSVPLEKLGGRASLRLDDLRPVSARLSVGPEKAPTLDLRAEFLGKPASFSNLRLHWNTLTLEATQIIDALVAAAASGTTGLESLAGLKELGITSGTLRTEGAVTLAFIPRVAFAKPEGRIRARGFSLRVPKAKLALGGIDLDFDLKRGGESTTVLSIEKALFRRMRGRLGTLRVFGSPPAKREVRLSAPGGIPLAVDGLALRFGTLEGTLNLDEPTPRSPRYYLKTALQLEEVGLDRVNTLACLGLKRVPPARMRGSFVSIELEPGMIDPTGWFQVDLYGGYVRLDEIGIFDLLSEVPEVTLDLEWDRIKLDEFGTWLGFGEMDGILAGHAHDIVFASWLPTHFDLKFDVLPYRHKDIVFSPEAMKNVARIFAADGIDKIPGIADWITFGWPSHAMGGFDVDYAGFSVTSEDGWVLLRTHDPPSISKDGEHYFVKGRRFKVPLRTSRYPLVMNATALANYAYMMSRTMSEIAASKKKEGTEHEQPTHPGEDACPAPSLE